MTGADFAEGVQDLNDEFENIRKELRGIKEELHTLNETKSAESLDWFAEKFADTLEKKIQSPEFSHQGFE